MRMCDSTDPTDARVETGSHVCRDVPDVGYCMLSERITSLPNGRPAASLPVLIFLSL